MAITRIKNNQITDLTIVANEKVKLLSVTAGLLQNDLVYDSDLTITGDLTVTGTTSTISTTNTVVEDPIMVLASTQTGAGAVDIGILGERGSDTNVFMGWDESVDQFIFALVPEIGDETTVVPSAFAPVKMGTLETTGGATFASLTVTGDTNLATVTATGLAQLDGGINVNDVFTVDAFGNTDVVNGTLDVGGLSTLNSASITTTLGVTGLTTLNALTIADTSAIDMGNNPITNVANPTNPQDVATQDYVDGLTGANVSFDIAGNTGAPNPIVGGETLSILGTANQVDTVVSANTITATLSSTIVTPGSVDVGTTLDVTGAATFDSTLDVTTGLTSLDGGLEVGPQFSVDTLGNTDTGTGTLTVGGISDFNGATTMGPLTIDATSVVSMGGNVVTNVATPLVSTDAANMDYVDTEVAGNTFGVTDNTTTDVVEKDDLLAFNAAANQVDFVLSGAGTALPVFDISLSSTIVTPGSVDVGTTLDVTNAATFDSTITAVGLAQLDGGIAVNGSFTVADGTGNISTSGTLNADGQTTLGAVTIDAISLIDLGANIATNAGTPTAANDLTTKSYVDNLVTGGTVWRDPVIDPNLVGVTATEPGSPGVGDGWITTASGTWTGSVAVVANDYAVWNGTAWVVVENVTAGDRFIIGGEGTTIDTSLYSVGFRQHDVVQYVSGAVGTFTSWDLPHDAYYDVIHFSAEKAAGDLTGLANGTTYVLDVSTDIGAGVVLSQVEFTAGVADSFTTLLAGINADLDTDFGSGAVVATMEPEGHIHITNVTANEQLTISAGTGTGTDMLATLTDFFAVYAGVQDGTTVLCNDPESFHNGHTYSYSHDANSWTEISGPGAIDAGTSLSFAGNVLNVDDDFVSNTGDIMNGNYTIPTTFAITMADAPSTGLALTNRDYVDGLITAGFNIAAGTNGSGGTNAIGGSETLTFNGTANEIDIVVGVDAVTIGLPASVTITTALTSSGTLDVTGVTTLTGSLLANGGINVDSGAFIVADNTGNVTTTGTLDVTGVTTLTGSLLANGGINVDSGAFIVADGTGDVSTTGTLDVTGVTTLTGSLVANGGINADSGAFIVADGTGDITTTGDLTVAGTTDLNGDNTLAGVIIDAAPAASGTLVVGRTYVIDTVTLVDWTSVGGSVTAAVGDVFTATATDASTLGTASTGFVSMGANKIINVTDPVADQDAATKAYVDTVAGSGFTLTGDSGSTTISGGDTLAVTGTAGETTVVAGTGVDTLVVGLATNVQVAGTLGVTGTSTLAATGVTGVLTVTGSAAIDDITIDGTDITTSAAELTINDAGADIDFRVEASGEANAIFVDGGTGQVLLGGATAQTGVAFEVAGNTSAIIASGNTADRPPIGIDGMMRYNTTLSQYEFFADGTWETFGTEFTVIASETFAGDDSTVAFTLTSAQTTASCIVSINGVVQLPTTAYGVIGTTLTFTEAPLTGDAIDVRTLTTTTSVTNLTDGSVAIDPVAGGFEVVGDFLPATDATYDLGSATKQWQDLHLVGTTIYLGGAQLQYDAGAFKFFEANGTTPADIDLGDSTVDGGTY